MSIIKIVEIENFQSHAHTKLELGPGLNVIVGPSDQGKSTVIRALRWVFYNEPRGMEFFRVGSNICRVVVTLDSGEQIVRERTNSRNRYIYRNNSREEEIFEGFGNTVPWEIAKILQMLKISLDKDTETTLNISHQLESPFLMNESGSLRAKMIGRLTGVHIIDAAIRDVARDLMNQQQEEKRLDEELKELTEELGIYSYLPELLENIKKEEKILEKIKILNVQMGLLQEIRRNWESLCEEEKKAGEFLSSLPPLDKVENLINRAEILNQREFQLDKLNQQWINMKKDLARANYFLEHTTGIAKGEELLAQAEDSVKRLKELLHLQEKIKTWKEQYQQAKDIWRGLTKVPESEETIKLVEDKVKKLEKLERLAKNLREIEAGIINCEQELEKLENKLNIVFENYQLKLKETGKCPLCFCPLDEETFRRITWNYSTKGGE